MSHEFWIEPTDYTVDPGAPITANFRNGEKLKGVPLPYFDRRSIHLDMAHNTQTTALSPRNGDLPAIAITAPETDGLLILTHQTAPSSLKYKTWEKFARFAEHKDFADIKARHTARNLPEQDFFETYSRFAKSLIAVGNGTGTDRRTGLETEFVALTNPYDQTFDHNFRARLFDGDAPRPDAQVEMFDRASDGTVTITLHKTDADGYVTLPVTPGHSYLLDAVILRPAPQDDRSVWETLWAALTFAVPE